MACCSSDIVTWYIVRTPFDDWTVRADLTMLPISENVGAMFFGTPVPERPERPFKLEVACVKMVKIEATGSSK